MRSALFPSPSRSAASAQFADRLYAAPLDSDVLVLPHAMKVHNVEWVADGAAQFIQAHTAAGASGASGGSSGGTGQPFFLYVGWTLPHGPDADKSLTDGRLGFTPAGNWKPTASLVRTAQQTRAEVRKKSRAQVDTGEEGGGVIGFQGHRNYAAALQWLDRGVGTVMWALQRKVGGCCTPCALPASPHSVPMRAAQLAEL